MSVLAITLSGRKRGTVRVFESEKVAIRTGNGYILFKSPEAMAADYHRFHVEDIFDAYNFIVPEKERWKSTDDIPTRVEGAIALWEAAHKRLPLEKEFDMARKATAEETETKVKGAKGKKATANGGGTRQPRHDYSGKTLKLHPDFGDKPSMREDSERSKALAPIVKAGKKGIKFEAWQAGNTELCTVPMLSKLIEMERVVAS